MLTNMKAMAENAGRATIKPSLNGHPVLEPMENVQLGEESPLVATVRVPTCRKPQNF